MPPDAPLPDAIPSSAPQASAPSLFEPATSASLSFVNNHSSPEEKIAFFRSLFRGREDVFARRWQSAASGKSGYSPACANEWKPGLCPKPKGTCSKCEQRKLIPLSNEILTAHLQGRDALGRDVIGLFPILPEDNCFFLALEAFLEIGEMPEPLPRKRGRKRVRPHPSPGGCERTGPAAQSAAICHSPFYHQPYRFSGERHCRLVY